MVVGGHLVDGSRASRLLRASDVHSFAEMVHVHSWKFGMAKESDRPFSEPWQHSCFQVASRTQTTSFAGDSVADLHGERQIHEVKAHNLWPPFVRSSHLLIRNAKGSLSTGSTAYTGICSLNESHHCNLRGRNPLPPRTLQSFSASIPIL